MEKFIKTIGRVVSIITVAYILFITAYWLFILFREPSMFLIETFRGI